jgi:hypothetical protein
MLAGCGSSDDAAIAQGVPTDVSGVTQNWDKVISGAGRFTVLSTFGGAAVRDNETGLVWERSPQATPATWNTARPSCAEKVASNRKGWRLPSFPELASLVDPSVSPPGPTLPAGHPFLNVQSDFFYWSATTNAENPTLAWVVVFGNGDVGSINKTNNIQVWCVRGGMQESVY